MELNVHKHNMQPVFGDLYEEKHCALYLGEYGTNTLMLHCHLNVAPFISVRWQSLLQNAIII
jgi:hypothetical protein